MTLIPMLMAVACGGGGLTAEQLKELEETKAAALTAEEKIQQHKVTRKTLSKNLALKKKCPVQAGVESSYFSLPSKEDMVKFRCAGGKIIRCGDLIWRFHRE